MPIYLTTQGALLLVAACATTSVARDNIGLAVGYGTMFAGLALILWAPFS